MMKLYCSANSPYARKVRVVARELNIADQIELIYASPRDETNGLREINPLSQIPTMVIANGDVIIDSPVICEYLNELYGNDKLLPPTQEERWKMRSLAELANGVLDAGMAVRVEQMRPDELQSTEFIERKFLTVKKGLARLEEQLDAYSESVNLVSISLACTIGWLRFRFDDIDWLGGHPKLAAWFAQFEARDSMAQTKPGDPLN